MRELLRKTKNFFQELLGNVRRWIDGQDDPVERMDDSVRELRWSERFLKVIAGELEARLQRESFAPPGLPVCTPQEFIVYLSYEDDKEWLGNKRRALKQVLNNALAERVRELGERKAGAPPPTVQLRVDGTLEEGQIRVQACWEPTARGTTLVVLPKGIGETDEGQLDDGEVTHVYLDDSSPDGDPTQIILPDRPLYQVEVSRANIREALIPVTQQVIRIGRGARSIPVDIRLKDPNVSRVHATLERDEAGRYWIVSRGQNPILIDGRQAARNERVQVAPDGLISICSYSLSIRECHPPQ